MNVSWPMSSIIVFSKLLGRCPKRTCVPQRNQARLRKFTSMVFWAIVFFDALKVSSRNISKTYRVKRVLNGEEINVRNQANYAVTRYYVTYATLHDFPFWSFSPFSFNNRKFYKSGVEKGYYGEIFCGGAVLTPEVVQTACHCVSEWRGPKRPSFVTRPVVSHEWEQVKVLYIGVNNRFYPDPAMISQKPIKSLKFIVHVECGRLSDSEYKPNSYDYAWIKIDPSWTYPGSGVPTYRLAFAPIYDSMALAELDEKIQKDRAVCLHIGFGRYAKHSIVTSPVLLHGWSSIISTEKCASITAVGVPDDSLKDLMNWFCVETFNKHLQPTQRGDSGGPVTCNDEYMGVVSGHLGKSFRDMDNHLYDVYWCLHGSTANTAYTMTSQWRAAFSKQIRDVDVKTYLDMIKEETRFALARRLRHVEVTHEHFSHAASCCHRTENSFTLIFIFTMIFLVLHQ